MPPSVIAVEVPPDACGRVDQEALKGLLERYADMPTIIGSFSAASNMTGIREQVQTGNSGCLPAGQNCAPMPIRRQLSHSDY